MDGYLVEPTLGERVKRFFLNEWTVRRICPVCHDEFQSFPVPLRSNREVFSNLETHYPTDYSNGFLAHTPICLKPECREEARKANEIAHDVFFGKIP